MSGIILYVAHESGTDNVSVIMDKNPNTTTISTLINNSTIEQYNITVYNNQSLAFGNHIVTVQLLTWVTGSNTTFWFDYAAVNDTQPSPSPSASLSPSTSDSSHSHINTGAIIGGVIGFLAVLAAVIVIFLVWQRKQKTTHKTPVANPIRERSSPVHEGNTHPYQPSGIQFYATNIDARGMVIATGSGPTQNAP